MKKLYYLFFYKLYTQGESSLNSEKERWEYGGADHYIYSNYLSGFIIILYLSIFHILFAFFNRLFYYNSLMLVSGVVLVSLLDFFMIRKEKYIPFFIEFKKNEVNKNKLSNILFRSFQFFVLLLFSLSLIFLIKKGLITVSF